MTGPSRKPPQATPDIDPAQAHEPSPTRPPSRPTPDEPYEPDQAGDKSGETEGA